MTLPEIDRILAALCSHERTWREVHPEVHSLINELQYLRAKRKAVIEQRLRSCPATSGDAIDAKTLTATIHSKKVDELARFRAQSPVCGFTLPAENVLGVDRGAGFSVSDGYCLMLRPLSPGKRRIHFEGACKSGSPCDGFSQDMTYELTVTK
ncbi:MAG TPA: hypothetical protein VEH53_02355 [archaeon]|nr:hypothetical protein [archaeon]